jgi:hypothetical protein
VIPDRTDKASRAYLHDEALSDAPSRWAFAGASRLRNGSTLQRSDLHQARRLARAGDVLLRLDFEDLDRSSEAGAHHAEPARNAAPSTPISHTGR